MSDAPLGATPEDVYSAAHAVGWTHRDLERNCRAVFRVDLPEEMSREQLADACALFDLSLRHYVEADAEYLALRPLDDGDVRW